jgi:deoxyuridine 5'-triphosphate nucleotidohydrolase
MSLLYEKVWNTAVAPSKPAKGSAGFDIFTAEDVVVPPRKKLAVCTGLKVVIPEGYYGRIAPREGLALNHALEIKEGTIDSDYRGFLRVVLFNYSHKEYRLRSGANVAQLILVKIHQNPELLECVVSPPGQGYWDNGHPTGSSVYLFS